MCAVNPFVVGSDDNMVHRLFIVSKVSSRWHHNMLDNMLNNCIVVSTWGFARIFFPKIRDYYGSGWVGSSLTLDFFGKVSQNSPKRVLIFWSSILCILSVHTLLNVVGYYDFLLELSMSVMGFQKKFGWGVGERDELNPILLGIFGFFLTLQSPL